MHIHIQYSVYKLLLLLLCSYNNCGLCLLIILFYFFGVKPVSITSQYHRNHPQPACVRRRYNATYVLHMCVCARSRQPIANQRKRAFVCGSDNVHWDIRRKASPRTRLNFRLSVCEAVRARTIRIAAAQLRTIIKQIIIISTHIAISHRVYMRKCS